MIAKLVSRFKKVRQERRAALDLQRVQSSGLFDREWYLQKYPDIAEAGVDPLWHFVNYGGLEGRNPGPDFYSRWYLNRYDDVKKSGMNPLLHYLKYGQREGRERAPRVYQLGRMYDYSRETNSIVFEDAPERIYLYRPNVIGKYSGVLNEGEALCPQAYVSVLQNVVVYGGRSLVIVENRLVLSDELVDFNSREFGKKATEMEVMEDGGVIFMDNKKINLHVKEAILLSCGHDYNYFHWLVECLPKLLLVDGLPQFKDVPLLVPTGLHPNLMAALERVNVNNRRLIFVEANTPCRVDRLIFPSALSQIVDRYEGAPFFNVDIVLSHRWLRRVSEILKGNVKQEGKPWRKLFLTRRKGLRQLGNRAEVELLLVKQGFEIVELDGASLDLQLELFSQAAMVVAPSGATLTNLLFCRPGTRVIIFMSNHEVTNFYFWSNLGAVNDLDITTIAGQRLFKLTNYYSVHDDYAVDPKVVLEEIAKKRAQMNYSRHLYFKTFLVSILEKCSEWDPRNTSLVGDPSWQHFLEAAAQAIRLEIRRIQSKQEGGYWQMTRSDRLFINYMNNTWVAINAALDKSSLSREEYLILVDRLNQLLKTAEVQHNPRIKAVFLLQETFTWPSFESVYETWAADPACEAQLVYVDFEHEHGDLSRNWLAEYAARGLPVIRYQDYDLSAESPDLVFFVKPYDTIPQAFYIENVEKVVSRSVYIPYFVNWMALKNIDFLIQYHFQLPLHEKAWKIFDAPDFIHKLHREYGARKGENVELIGHPRFDIIGKLEKFSATIPVIWKKKIANRRVVMWNTHSYIATENWSTFGTFGRQILEYFESNRQLALLWRPHPHFFQSLVNGGVMTKDQVDELIALVTISENMVLDQTSDYRAAFSVADGLMSDASSLLVEFLLTRKPVLYTCNESNYSILHENLLPAFYKASTWEDVEKFLQRLLEGTDDKLGERMQVVESCLPNAGKDVGKLVMDKCIRDLIAEETSAGRILSLKQGEEIRVK